MILEPIYISRTVLIDPSTPNVSKNESIAVAFFFRSNITTMFITDKILFYTKINFCKSHGYKYNPNSMGMKKKTHRS